MRDLIRALDAPIPANVREVSEGLQYRDFITVGLLCDRLKVHEPDGGLLKDTWIYVQEPDVLLGRLQIFNNWSPHLVSDPTKVWIGLEYFCYETDDLWKMNDAALQQFAIAEVAKIGIVEADAVTDGHVVRVPKTYPAYFGTYDRFGELRTFTDSFENLFLIGRNGMHKYNNQDHSMLTAMTVVDGLCAGHVDKPPCGRSTPSRSTTRIREPNNEEAARFILVLLLVAFLAINRQRVYLRDPLARVSRDSSPVSGVTTMINFNNDVLLLDNSDPQHHRVYLVQGWNKLAAVPTVALRCEAGLACMADADQATATPITPGSRGHREPFLGVTMTNRRVEFVDEEGALVLITLR